MIEALEIINNKRLYYVYALVCPLTEKPFYIGKGKGRRMFKHQKDVNDGDFSNPYKAQHIRDLNNQGHQIKYEILFYSTSERDCYKKESDLIKTTPGLTNIVHGNENCPDGLYKDIKEIAEKVDTSEGWISRMNPSEWQIESDKVIRSKLQEMADDVCGRYPFLPWILVPA